MIRSKCAGCGEDDGGGGYYNAGVGEMAACFFLFSFFREDYEGGHVS